MSEVKRVARDIQAGTSGFLAIGQDLRVTDVHPPLYFWLLALAARLSQHAVEHVDHHTLLGAR